MKISTRLNIATIFCGLVVLVIVWVLLYTTTQMKRELLKNEQAGEVLQAVTALRYLSMEYELHHGERAQDQWQLRSASFSRFLVKNTESADPVALELINSLRNSQVEVETLFGFLVTNYHEMENDQGRREVLEELESRLSGQISNKTQSMIFDALTLSDLSRKAVLAAQQRANIAVILFGLLAMLAVVATIFIALRSVLRPMEKLREGTSLVGAGNLDFSLRVNSQDEIGDLARAFDSMTEKLKLTTVSRDELVKTNEALAAEITVRQHAEQRARAQLERLNLLHQITRSTGARQDMQSIFQVVIRSLEDQLPIDFVCLYLYDQPQNSLVVACVGFHSEALISELGMTEKARIPIDENGLSQCISGKLVYEPDISNSTFPFPQRLAKGGLRALVMAPLLVDSTVFGVLVVGRRAAHSFASGECEFLSQLCEHVALSANQAQLHAAVQQAYDDLRQTQQTVMQQERLRSLGQMASGIAHDINNAISPIALYTELLLGTEPSLTERGRNYLEVIQRAIDDVAATVARMREFYRQRETQLTLSPVDANVLIKQVVDLTRARWSDMPQQRGVVIKLNLELDPDLPFFMGVDGEIREALTNLVFNAVDAMPDGGQLTLRTRVAGVPDRNQQTVSQYVFIEVADSGMGMDEETRRRCLEPFFTTKGERGTGLGLAMVYGMVERHSALVELESQLNVGTTVRLSFLVPTEEAAAPSSLDTTSAPTNLKILIVDDDPLVLRSLRDILTFDGHTVVAADGGQNGINQFHSSQERGELFSVVITDLGMPYVDGHKVATAIKHLSPSTPVILLTGWGQRLVTDGVAPGHVDCVLSKPPRLKELRQALIKIFQTSSAIL